MEATYRAFGGRLLIKINAETVKQLFKEIGSVAEVLDVDAACGKCHSPNIYPNVREAKSDDGSVYEYYELNCSDCGARLDFGQNKKGGGLFPKRDKGDADTRGWYIYRALEAPAATTTQGLTSAPRQAPAAPRPTAAAPGALPPDPPALQEMIRRAAGNPSQVFGELCDAIALKMGGQSRADRAWNEALELPGSTIESTVRYLYGVLAKAGKI